MLLGLLLFASLTSCDKNDAPGITGKNIAGIWKLETQINIRISDGEKFVQRFYDETVRTMDLTYITITDGGLYSKYTRLLADYDISRNERSDNPKDFVPYGVQVDGLWLFNKEGKLEFLSANIPLRDQLFEVEMENPDSMWLRGQGYELKFIRYPRAEFEKDVELFWHNTELFLKEFEENNEK